MKFKKFNIAYESVMKSIITEDWDRFHLTDIVQVTQAVTHNFKDEWQKATTGKEIVRELMTFWHKRANYHVEGKGKSQYTYEPDFDKEMATTSDIINTCNGYWMTRAKNGGGSFASECYRIFQSYLSDNPRFGKAEYIAPEVGKVAWATWKAMNARLKKTEANLQKAADMNLDSMFKIGEKVTFDLKVKYVATKSNMYGSSQHLKGTDEAKWPGVTLDVVAGTKMQKQMFSDFANCPKQRQGCGIMGYAVEGDTFRITAKVKSVYKEGMTVFFNFGIVDDVLAFGETKEDKEKLIFKELDEYKDKIIAKIDELCDDDTEAFDLAVKVIPDIQSLWTNQDALTSALSLYSPGIIDAIISSEKSTPLTKKAFTIIKNIEPEMTEFVNKIRKAKKDFK